MYEKGEEMIDEKEKIKMSMEDLTLSEIKKIKSMFCDTDYNHPYKVGKNYFIRTVTYHITGKLLQVTQHELVLTNAAWIADSGRFMNFLKDGTPSEVEPFPDGAEVIVGRGAVIDAVEWTHALPREQK